MNNINYQSNLSVNLHLTEKCNFHCGFCFAKYAHGEQQTFIVSHDNALENVKYISGQNKVGNNFSSSSIVINDDDVFSLIKSLADYGFKKISFAGGEPLLVPDIAEYIRFAKQIGLSTMLITNGSLLYDQMFSNLKGFLDWIGLSVDSLNPKTNTKIGRASVFSSPFSGRSYETLCKKIKCQGIRLKINTVVNKYNLNVDFRSFILNVKPVRWKVMQVIFNTNVNDKGRRKFSITTEQFWNFFLDNYIKDSCIVMIPEPEDLMRESYLMIDPSGRFYDNSDGRHNYSRKILDVGIETALKDVKFDYALFQKRGGLYNY